jgi:curli biogenesis system outer membrane secretion channel CsgG
LPWVHHGRAQFHLGMQTTSALPIGLQDLLSTRLAASVIFLVFNRDGIQCIVGFVTRLGIT